MSPPVQSGEVGGIILAWLGRQGVIGPTPGGQNVVRQNGLQPGNISSKGEVAISHLNGSRRGQVGTHGIEATDDLPPVYPRAISTHREGQEYEYDSHQ